MKPEYVSYTDATGREYTETVTSPIALILREEELERQGYIITRG